LGLPLALLLAGVGGYLLASRALQPVDGITQTAQAISASDLDQRIYYQGPADEIGRLASTFDNMLDRLQAAFVRERRFTGDAAHELRTPLAALKGRIGVTLSQPRQAEAYAETLQDMEVQVDRLIRLSNDLLLMARLDQGQLRPQLDTIIFSDFLGAVVDQVRPLLEAKSINLTTTIPPDLTLEGDLDLLIRLHLNLLDNAVKYTPPGGRVAVEAEGREKGVTISISDNGPGIQPEHLPYLFDRFYRVESDRSRAGQQPVLGGSVPGSSPKRREGGQGGGSTIGGDGLGLAIAYEIVRAHGGELSVQSEVGQGTTLVVNLPVAWPAEL
jgi:signal transduction histidine kinase